MNRFLVDDFMLNNLLDAWYLMRIVSLAPPIISKQKPQVSFTFSNVINLCNQLLYSKKVIPITFFSIGKKTERFDNIFDTCNHLNFKTKAKDFTKFLNILDNHNGVFLTSHWLAYIFDYQEKADYIWAHFPMFYSMATELFLEKDAETFNKTFIAVDRLEDPWMGQRLTHRFYEQHKIYDILSRTAKILCDYGGSLTAYIDKVLRDCPCVVEENWIRLMAAAINFLTYEKHKIKLNLCQYAEERNFLIPQKIVPATLKIGGEKRLWSALRDYIVDPYFRGLLINGLGENNPAKQYLKNLDAHLFKNETSLSQLELPGDIWNEEFMNTHLKKLKEKNPDQLKKIIIQNSRISVRRFYHWLLKHEGYYKRVFKEKLFPIYLDATFGLRKGDLHLLMNKSSDIKLKIQSEIGDLNNEEDFIKSHYILRRKLQNNF